MGDTTHQQRAAHATTSASFDAAKPAAARLSQTVSAPRAQAARAFFGGGAPVQRQEVPGFDEERAKKKKAQAAAAAAAAKGNPGAAKAKGKAGSLGGKFQLEDLPQDIVSAMERGLLPGE